MIKYKIKTILISLFWISFNTIISHLIVKYCISNFIFYSLFETVIGIIVIIITVLFLITSFSYHAYKIKRLLKNKMRL